MASPVSPKRRGIDGHDQNRPKLMDDIMKGFKEFSSVVEVIRMLEPNKVRSGRLIADFVKFRDLVAHKGLNYVDITFVQMVTAFVIHCRTVLNFPHEEVVDISKVSHQPKSTKTMSKKFARMADINAAVCAKWFWKLLEIEKKDINAVRCWLEKMFCHSSYTNWEFTISTEEDCIKVNRKDGDPKQTFDLEWVDEFINEVRESDVSYNAEENEQLKKVYDEFKTLI